MTDTNPRSLLDRTSLLPEGAGTGGAGGGFRNDTRGAVMFIALFMIMMLVGSLWGLIGIGDAVVHKAMTQEATDSGALSSATIQAKGMNVIAFLNCLLFAMTFIWIVICLIVDVLLVIIGLAISSIVGTFAVPTLITTVYTIDQSIAGPYKEFMFGAAEVIAGVQTGTAYLSPWGGMVASLAMSGKYDFKSISFSPSMIPGSAGGVQSLIKNIPIIGDAISVPGAAASAGGSRGVGNKLGLPVETMPMNHGCTVAVSMIFEKLIQLITSIPLFGLFEQPIRTFVQPIANATSSSAKIMHCNDGKTDFDGKVFTKKEQKGCGFGDVVCHGLKIAMNLAVMPVKWMLGLVTNVYKSDPRWGESARGPKEMFEEAANGNEWMSVYAATFDALKDLNAEKVQIATLSYVTKALSPEANVFFTRAEFYYDCAGKWTEKCNGLGPGGKGSAEYSYALYSMNWRAREVRYKGFLSSVGKIISGCIGNLFKSSSVLTWIRDKADMLKSSTQVLDKKMDLGMIVGMLFGKEGEGTQKQFETYLKVYDDAVKSASAQDPGVALSEEIKKAGSLH
jgi:hypothetical protein